MTVNDIEFFTVTTENGSDFFLVVDRQRTSNNVYLLNTVTEADLMALAEARGDTMPPGSSNMTTQPPTQENQSAPSMEEILQTIQEANEENQEAQAPTPTPQGNSSGIIVLLVIVLVLGGGGFFAWKFLWPMLQKTGQGNQEEIEEDYDDEQDNDDMDYSEDFEAVEVDEDEEFNQDSDYDEGGGADDEE